MSDFMLLGVLRMPMPDKPDAMTLLQFVSRARQAADRIEADGKKIEGLREALRQIADPEMRNTESMRTVAALALGPNARFSGGRRPSAGTDS